MINVQPSLIIWTVICFGLFMLVLDRLLFRPLLKLMDERRERTEGARLRLAEAREAHEAELEEARSREEANRIAAIESERLEAERIRKNAEEELRALTRELEAEKLRNREEAERLMNEALESVTGSLDDMSGVYSDKLIKDGR